MLFGPQVLALEVLRTSAGSSRMSRPENTAVPELYRAEHFMLQCQPSRHELKLGQLQVCESPCQAACALPTWACNSVRGRCSRNIILQVWGRGNI